MPIYDSSRNKEPPISNHAVHDRATARSLERHHQRLRTIAQQNIRPYNVGDGWSHSKPRYEHLTHNLKRAQLEGERYADISRDNQNLLRKIALMEQSAVLDPTEGTWEFAPGVRLNRFQVPVIDHCISLQPQMRGAAKVPESLNSGARKRELERITRENLGIVQRIQNCPPSEQTRLDALRAHAAKNERIRHRIRQPKLGLGFHSPSPSPSAETRLATPQLRGATAPAPSQMPRRVFTPAQVFAPFERRGEPVPSALLRDAAEGATELLVGVASGFVPGSMALVDDQHVPISSASLCREGLRLHLHEPLDAGYAAGTPVRQLRPASASTPSSSPRGGSSRPATRDGGGFCGGAWRDEFATPQFSPRPATGDPLRGSSRPGTRPGTRPGSRRGGSGASERRIAVLSSPRVRARCEPSPGGVTVKLAL